MKHVRRFAEIERAGGILVWTLIVLAVCAAGAFSQYSPDFLAVMAEMDRRAFGHPLVGTAGDTMWVSVVGADTITIPANVQVIVVSIRPEYVFPQTLVDLKFRTDSLLWKMYETYMGLNARTYFSGSYSDAEVEAMRKAGAFIGYVGVKSSSTGKTSIRGYKP